MDADPTGLASCEVPLRDYGRRLTFCGPIRTVTCRDDSALIKVQLARPGLGGVLIVDGDGSTRAALMGDRVAGMALANGWAGVVIFGMVRDVAALSTLDFGVKALGANPRKPGGAGIGVLDMPVSFGGVTFEPGATVWCDADGVVVPAHRTRTTAS